MQVWVITAIPFLCEKHHVIAVVDSKEKVSDIIERYSKYDSYDDIEVTEEYVQ